MDFKDFNLKDDVLKAIDNINFVKPTNTQQLVLPHALKNENLACKGKTGSGKTHCFLIPIANKIDVNDKTLQALILVPTRELALQIYQRCKEFLASFNLKIVCLTGGNDINKDISNLKTNPQILIGTPEKITKLVIDEGLINLSFVKTLVIDEADMTLEMGFLNEVDRIAFLSKNAQIMVFSATIPVAIKQFIKKYFKNPLIIEDYKNNYNNQIKHILYPTRNKDRNEVVLNILKHINPYVCLIFASTKEKVEQTYKYLTNNGIECGIIHGNLQARERKSSIKKALLGQYRYIVCSDIASRGIDIEGVSHVISIDFPKNNLEFYTHRAGRAGRINTTGFAISLFDNKDNEVISILEKQGIVFEIQEIKNGEFVTLKEFDARNKRKGKSKIDEDLANDINKAIRMNKSKKVKPNHKKKVKMAVEKVKRKYKREMIEKSIKEQKRKKYSGK